MTTSPPSSFSDGTARAFDRLHPSIQRWIWEKGWQDLRPVQEEAVGPILGCNDDVIVTAATAGGKTEAAFLPILTHIAERPAQGVRVLYISPLRALINDQFDRLESLGERIGVRFHRWHGDVPSSSKQKVLADPDGVLLITPESLEALFVLRGQQIAQLLQGLSYAVVDELHALIGSERGAQLLSLLHRVELALGRRVPRIGLSATLGDMSLAAQALRSDDAARVHIVSGDTEERELKLSVRGYRDADDDGTKQGASVEAAMAEHLFDVLRGRKNLVFANSRSGVERFADLLRQKCEKARVPQEFWPHHGSLSRQLREDVERILKQKDRPVTAICTSTLELGIDIGAVESVAQLGVPPSCASLRQRLGRSGRRKGQAAILRAFVDERPIRDGMPLEDELRLSLVQTVATITLLLRRWCEPSSTGELHLSTLVHQVLSLVAQHGGVTAAAAWATLCGPGGPFGRVQRPTFVRLLRAMGDGELLTQSEDGTLLPGPVGERLVNHYTFYTVFQSSQEYRLVSDGQTLGTLPISSPLYPELPIIFAGRRWKVLDVDERSRIIELAPATDGKVPRFGGGIGQVHDGIRHEMRRIYLGQDVPSFLDTTARELLAEARRAFAAHGLGERSVVQQGARASLLHWEGDRRVNALQLHFACNGLEVERTGPIISTVQGTAEQLQKLAHQAVTEGLDLVALARAARNKLENKFDQYLGEELLCLEYASRELAW